MEDDVQTNAGNEWPSYELPSEVTPEPAAAAQPAAQPASSATPPVAPAAPAGGTPPAQPATPQGGVAAVPPAGPSAVPENRLNDDAAAERDRYRAQLEVSQTQIATLTGLVQRLTAGATTPPADPNAPPAAAAMSPEDQRVRERLLQVLPELAVLTGPELKELLAKRTEVLGVVGDTTRWRASEQAITDQFVESSIETVFDQIAAHTLGEGKKSADLSELVKNGAVAAFARWVSSDAKRSARYERHDPAIVGEFWTAYKAAVYDPVRRDGAAALLQRAGNPPAVPVGGAQPPLAPAAPKTPNPLDEDAIHASAWNMRDEVGASR